MSLPSSGIRSEKPVDVFVTPFVNATVDEVILLTDDADDDGARFDDEKPTGCCGVAELEVVLRVEETTCERHLILLIRKSANWGY